MFAYCRNNPVKRIDVSGWYDLDIDDVDPIDDELEHEEGYLGGGTTTTDAKSSGSQSFSGTTPPSTTNASTPSAPTPSGSNVSVHQLCDGKITGYTAHGLHQATTRDGVGVKPSAILDTVRNPQKVVHQDEGKIKYIGTKAVVVTNSLGRIITTYAKSRMFTRVG